MPESPYPHQLPLDVERRYAEARRILGVPVVDGATGEVVVVSPQLPATPDAAYYYPQGHNGHNGYNGYGYTGHNGYGQGHNGFNGRNGHNGHSAGEAVAIDGARLAPISLPSRNGAPGGENTSERALRRINKYGSGRWRDGGDSPLREITEMTDRALEVGDAAAAALLRDSDGLPTLRAVAASQPLHPLDELVKDALALEAPVRPQKATGRAAVVYPQTPAAAPAAPAGESETTMALPASPASPQSFPPLLTEGALPEATSPINWFGAKTPTVLPAAPEHPAATHHTMETLIVDGALIDPKLLQYTRVRASAGMLASTLNALTDLGPGDSAEHARLRRIAAAQYRHLKVDIDGIQALGPEERERHRMDPGDTFDDLDDNDIVGPAAKPGDAAVNDVETTRKLLVGLRAWRAQ